MTTEKEVKRQNNRVKACEELERLIAATSENYYKFTRLANSEFVCYASLEEVRKDRGNRAALVAKHTNTCIGMIVEGFSVQQVESKIYQPHLSDARTPTVHNVARQMHKDLRSFPRKSKHNFVYVLFEETGAYKDYLFLKDFSDKLGKKDSHVSTNLRDYGIIKVEPYIAIRLRII